MRGAKVLRAGVSRSLGACWCLRVSGRFGEEGGDCGDDLSPYATNVRQM